MARARALKLVVLATLAFAAVPMSPAAAHDPEFYYHRTVPAAGQNYVHWYTVSTPQTWTPALELAAHAWNSLPANLDLLYIGPAAVNYNPRGTCAYDVTDLWDRGRTNGIHHIDDSAEFPGQPGYNGAVIVCDATGGTDASLGETIVTHQMLFDVRNRFNTSVDGSESPGAGLALQAVATHEFGHVLGHQIHWQDRTTSLGLCSDDDDYHTMCSGIDSWAQRRRTLQHHDAETFMKMYPLPGGNCSGGSAAAPQAEDDETSSAGTVCHPDEDGVIGDPSSMSSAGGSVLYASLTVGQQYRATVSGTIDYTNYSKDAFGAPNRLADPECTTNKEDAIDGSKWLPHRWLATFGDDRVDVVSDAGDGTTKTFYDWTPLTPFPVGSLDGDIACSTDRKYTTTFTAVSNSMRFYLWDGVYDDNSGSFEIQVDLA